MIEWLARINPVRVARGLFIMNAVSVVIWIAFFVGVLLYSGALALELIAASLVVTSTLSAVVTGLRLRQLRQYQHEQSAVPKSRPGRWPV